MGKQDDEKPALEGVQTTAALTTLAGKVANSNLGQENDILSINGISVSNST
jgi:hypothetical protein